MQYRNTDNMNFKMWGQHNKFCNKIMTTSYKLCKYPSNGYGSKNNQFYLINQFGHIFEFTSEYDRELDEKFWSIEIPGYGQFNGATVREIVDTMKLYDIKITRW